MVQGEQRRPQGVLLALNRRLWSLFIFLLISSGCLLMIFSRQDVSQEQTLGQQLADMQARLQHLDMLHRARLEEAHLLSKQLALLLAAGEGGSANMSSPVKPGPQRHVDTSGPLLKKNTSLARGYQTLQLPTIYTFLPHLLANPQSLNPAFTISRNRSGVSVVMGIPTVMRESNSYLLSTLKNLLDNMSDDEAADCLIIVFVAEVKHEHVLEVAKQIETKFRDQVETGLIEVISPPASYYPDLDNLQLTLGDSPERVRWRTKQNLDFAFLMMYAQPKGTFYVQLEDDILAKKNFISTMKNYALQKIAEKSPWFVIQFCELGFIGKLFECSRLPWLIQYMLMFFNDKPVDWLLDHYVQSKACRLDKNIKTCGKEKAKLWVSYNGSLFQHVGLHSSLKGKVQRLQDKKFGKMKVFYPHTNPGADVTSSVQPHKQFSLARAYKGETYFWGIAPKARDHLTFTFNKPQHLKRYLFRSGNIEHVDDCFYNTTVEVMPETSEINVSKSQYNVTSDGFYVVGEFDAIGLAEGQVDPRLNPVKVVRLNVHSDSENWVILSEIFLEVAGSR